MKSKSLQDQYNLIREGKGHKGMFLREAKRMFSHMLSNSTTFKQAEHILKHRGVLNENYVDLKPIHTHKSKKEDYETAFANFLSEAEVKSVEKKTSKEVMDNQTRGYDMSDKSKLDNQIGSEIQAGVYAEAKKDPEATIEEIKEIVAKNLEKDPLYYKKNFAFGVDGIGYEEPEMMQTSGKYEGSGYSEKLKKLVKESLMGPLKENYTKETLRKALGNMDDAFIQTSGGEEYIIYNPDNNNDDNAAMWGDDSIFALDQDGEEHEIRYSNISNAYGSGPSKLNESEVLSEGIIQALNQWGSPEEVEMYIDSLRRSNDDIVLWDEEDFVEDFKNYIADKSLEEDAEDNIYNDSIAAQRERDPENYDDLNEEEGDDYINPDEDQSEPIEEKPKKKKVKKDNLQTKLAEIDAQGAVVTCEAKIEAIDEEINRRSERLSMIDENSDLAELIDKKRLKMMQNEIKTLEKEKGRHEKMYEKLTKSPYQKKEIIGGEVEEGAVEQEQFESEDTDTPLS